MPDDIKRVLVTQCGPVLMGVKPAALFPLPSEQRLACLSALLPRNLTVLVLRQTGNRPLVLLYEKNMLKKTLSSRAARYFLSNLGYPAALSAVLRHLKTRVTENSFPHEIGLFLGYPLEDVTGFMHYKGLNCKFCGYWKVYGDVEKAKRLFRQYDLCRECVESFLAGSGNAA